MFVEASPELFLEGYRQGIFPMAESADDPHYNFYAPHQRALLPIKDLHIPKRLLRTIKQGGYEIKINTAFEEVIEACGESKDGRESTWINQPIRDTFIELHHLGHAHSIEYWQNNRLCGGLYGLAIGAVFCGESMFSTEDNASKIALVHLCARLQMGNFEILDSQFSNPHLMQFGLYEIAQDEYMMMIQTAMDTKKDFLLENKNEEEILESYFSNRD
ncbi:MAG: leucyl/phenylalanyl-tRNA--protein transferase [Pseudomonadota bacterium]